MATAPFGSGGQAENAVLYPNAGTANDGKIVLVGDQATWEAVRFNANGSLDTSFGNGGEAVTPFSGRSWGVAVDANGRILIVGGNLARLNVDGMLDTSFGSGGLVTTPVGATGVAVYPNVGTPNDGMIVTVGQNTIGTTTDFAVARFLGDSTSFAVAGFPSPDTAGVAGAFTVTVKNASGGTNTSYTGTVHFSINAPASVTHGVAFTLTVTALDPFGNVATGYTGTVHFTSSDSTATLPANYVFTAGDGGGHTFVNKTILRKKGTKTVTVTDKLNSGLTGSDSFNVA